MTRPQILTGVFVILVAWLGLASRTSASDHGYVVIVHPDNPITAVDRDTLQRVFLKKRTEWAQGGSVRPISLTQKFPVREQFNREILKKTPSQLRNYWNQRIFSGKGVPPPEADSTAAVIAYVLAHPGAIGYLPKTAETDGVKVIKLK